MSSRSMVSDHEKITGAESEYKNPCKMSVKVPIEGDSLESGIWQHLHVFLANSTYGKGT